MTQLFLYFTLTIAALLSAGDSVKINTGAAFEQPTACADQALPEPRGVDDSPGFIPQLCHIFSGERVPANASHYLAPFLPRIAAGNSAIRAPPLLLS